MVFLAEILVFHIYDNVPYPVDNIELFPCTEDKIRRFKGE